MVDNPKMDIRVIRGTYTYIEKNKKKEREVTVETQYFTNLNDEFDISNIVDLYHHERWNVETAYDVLKNNLDIEQYNTHNPIGIINETMGKVIFYNIEQIIFIESKKESNKIMNADINIFQTINILSICFIIIISW